MRKSSRAKILLFIVYGFIYGTLGFLGFFSWPGPSQTPQTFTVSVGTPLGVIAHRLFKKGLITSPTLFYYGVRLSGNGRTLKAGDYSIPAGASPSHILHILKHDTGSYLKVTIPEGLTNAQVLGILKSKDFLIFDDPKLPMEGFLYPETYTVARGTPLSFLLGDMKEQMEKTLEGLWSERQEGLPLKTPLEALILASIVEKEAHIHGEKPMVAAVYLNRLKRGMRLQADPTTIYCITDGTGSLDRALRREDLKCPGLHNTYVHKGLPPTPICAPSAASLRAVLHPASTRALYFVANGDGGHTFSTHYHRHRRHVAKLRQLR